MALIICTECDREFSDKAEACPNCGCPTEGIIAEIKEKEFKESIYKEVAEEILPTLQSSNENNIDELDRNCDDGDDVVIIPTTSITSAKREKDNKINLSKNEKNRNKIDINIIKKVVIALLTICVIIASIMGIKAWNEDRFDWTEIYLSNLLPEPTSSKGYIYENSEQNLDMDIYKTSTNDFADYVDLCESSNYTIDKIKTNDHFEAYNKNGYKLTLSYDDYSKEMAIMLEEPMQLETIAWPTEGLATEIPAMSSTEGIIEENNSTCFVAYIGNMSKSDFKAYIELCKTEGFISAEATDNDLCFKAENAEEYEIELEYMGFNVVHVTVKEPIYSVSLDIKCKQNFIFDIYDLDIYINDEFETCILHGERETIDIELKKGNHKLKICSAEDSSVKKVIDLEITESDKFRYIVTCNSNSIKVKYIPRIQVPITNENAIGKNVNDVIDMYEDAGFTNIETKVTRDITPSNANGLNTVEKIKIHNSSNFSSEDKFFANRKIIINYHGAKKIKVPDDSNDLEELEYLDVVNKFKESGFTNVSIAENETVTTSFIGDISDIEIGEARYFDENDKYPWDTNVVITYYVADEKGLAKIAFENYGEGLYPYGFKCKWFVGLIHEEETPNGWYFKVEVKLKDVYGNKLDGVAEGIATSSGVSQFHVNY